MENKFEEDYINEKVINQDAKFKEICSSLLEEVKTEIVKEVKIEKIELDKAMFQKQIQELKKLNIKNEDGNEEKEQYGRRLYLRID